MSRPALGALTTAVLSLSLLAFPGASPGSSAEQSAPSLTASPDLFVGGQSLRFAGRLSGAPSSRLRIETIFNRSGDDWILRDGIVATTDSHGDFAFDYPAPSNVGIRFRVRADNGTVSPAVVLDPRQQEIVLSLDEGADQARGTVVAGDSFTIDVDTTPTGRGVLGRPPPPIPGRQLTLQERVRSDQWSTIDTTTTSYDGTARFILTAGPPQETAYRVVQERVVTDGNKIGWFPSFPLDVSVAASSAAARAATTAPASPTPRVRTAPTAGLSRSGGATPLASARYLWGPSLFDFAWETGESLTDKPYRGSNRTGGWVDASDGSGRVAQHNGGMAITSNISEFPGDGDHGSTSATLEGNAMTYGRWEFRRRVDVFENVGSAYHVKIELVPARPEDARCGSNTINVADVTFNSTRATLGVSSARAGRQWTGSRRIPRLGNGAHSFAVEVMRDHITWFLDGRSLATVKQRRAIPGVPLTPRLSLVGRGQDEMRRTRVIYDWQRGWNLNPHARKAATGSPLQAKPLAAC